MNQTRVLKLNKNSYNGQAVIYVMSRDQRVQDNHALIAAQSLAIEHSAPLYVLFNLMVVKNRAREHYDFMLMGLREVADELESLNINFVMKSGDMVENIMQFSSEVQAGAIFFDFSPLKASRERAKRIAASFNGIVSVVDTHNIIPVWIASDKCEFAAYTMRLKVHLALEKYIVTPEKIVKHTSSTPIAATGITFKEAETYVTQIPEGNIRIEAIPGQRAATQHLERFIAKDLAIFAMNRNDIANDQQSGLSPYLHYGHISSLRVALEVIKQSDQRPLLFKKVKLAVHGETASIYDGVNALLEQMVVRKELADNFCFYSNEYRTISAGPEWAVKSLAEHANDPREHIYSREQWENAQTHDLSWNAAQNQLRRTGKIHGYMRMYWAKKILEWSATPDVALADCIYLNDTYSMDGADPNGYVGILWSIVGLHDRPWFDRPVFGKVRYMNEGGLMSKYDIAAYQKQWNG